MLQLMRDNILLSIFVVLASLFLWSFLTAHRERSYLLTLGALPPHVASYLPFGLDITIRNIRSHSKHEDLTWWIWLFSHAPVTSPTISINVFGTRVILTADPTNIKAILSTQFHNYGKGKAFHDEWVEFLGDGIFNSDHELWAASRQLLRPQFARERVRELPGVFERHLGGLIARVKEKRGGEVDVAELFYMYALDVATEYLFGRSVQSLSLATSKKQLGFIKAFNEVQRQQAFLGKVGPLRAFLSKKAYRQALETIDAFIYPFVDEALASNEFGVDSGPRRSFLYALAATGEKDRKVFRDQCLNILLAGRDSTAGTLSFLFKELAKHPDVVQKLRREIMSKVGAHERPTYEDLKDMPYLKNTINETLRLYPPVPFNVSDRVSRFRSASS